MKRDIITSAIGIFVLTLLCGVIYPLFITGVSQVAFPGNANGQQLFVKGKLVGSKIIGQSFAQQVTTKAGLPVLYTPSLYPTIKCPVVKPSSQYFQTRPSGTGPLPPYMTAGATPDNAAASAFSNLGPNSVDTAWEIECNIAAYISLEKPYYPGGLTADKVPVDAADSSASGIDPEISVANADIQAYRLAAVRHLSRSTVDHLISAYTLGRGLGFSGEPGVDVLELNLALNRLSPSTS